MASWMRHLWQDLFHVCLLGKALATHLPRRTCHLGVRLPKVLFCVFCCQQRAKELRDNVCHEFARDFAPFQAFAMRMAMIGDLCCGAFALFLRMRLPWAFCHAFKMDLPRVSLQILSERLAKHEMCLVGSEHPLHKKGAHVRRKTHKRPN